MGGLHLHGKDIYQATGSTQWYRLYDYMVDSSDLIKLAIADHVFNGSSLKDNLHKLAMSSARSRFKNFNKFYNQSELLVPGNVNGCGHSYDGHTDITMHANDFALCLGGIPSTRWATDWNCNFARPIVGKAIDYFDYKKWALAYLVEEEYNKKYGDKFLMMTLDKAQLSWRDGFNISDIEHDREGGVEYTEKVQVGEETKIHFKGDTEIRTKTITDTSLSIEPTKISVDIPEDYDWDEKKTISDCTAPLFLKLEYDISEMGFVETPDVSFTEDFKEKYVITKGQDTVYDPYITIDFNEDLTKLTINIGSDVWFHSNDEDNSTCEFEIKEAIPITLEGTVEYTYTYEEDTEYTEPVYEEYKHNEKVNDNTILGTIYINASGWNRTWVPHTQFHNNDGEYVSQRTSISFEYEFSRAKLRKAFKAARTNPYIEKVLGTDFTDTDVIKWMSETTYNCVDKPKPIQFFNPLPTSQNGNNFPGRIAQRDPMIRKAFKKLTGHSDFITKLCNATSKTSVTGGNNANIHRETMCLFFGVRASDHKKSINEYIFKWIKQMSYYTRASKDVVGMWDYDDHVTTRFCLPVADCQSAIPIKGLPSVENNCFIFQNDHPWYNLAYTWAGICHYIGKSSYEGPSKYELWVGPKIEGGVNSDLGWIYAVHINSDGSYEIYGIEDLGILSMNYSMIDLRSQQGPTSILDGTAALDDFYAQVDVDNPGKQDSTKGFIYPLSKDIIRTLNAHSADEIFNRFIHAVDFQWTLYKLHIKWYQRSMSFFKVVLGGLSLALGSITGIAGALGIHLPRIFQALDPWSLVSSILGNALAKMGVSPFLIPLLSSIPSGQIDQLKLQWGTEKMIVDSLKPEPYSQEEVIKAVNNANWTKQTESVQAMNNKSFGAEHQVNKRYTRVAEGVGFNYRLFDNQYLGRDLQNQMSSKLDLSGKMQVNSVDISYI